MSAHISQRSFLYGEGFFHNRADTDKQKKTNQKNNNKKQQQIRGRKMRKDKIRWMKRLSGTVKSVTARIANVKSP